jgi:6-phosphofructokinase
VLANLFGQKAVEGLLEGRKEVMTSIVNEEITVSPLEGIKRTLGDKEINMLNLVEKLAI